MLFIRIWQLGIKSLLLHPLRSILAMLGILIGVTSVIWLLAIGEGISQEAQRQIEGLGAKNIIVRSVKPPSEATAGNRGPTPYGLKRSEYDKLQVTLKTVLESSLPIREIRRQFRYSGRLVDGRLVGCTPEYAEVTSLTVAQGRFLEDSDILHRHNHCVLAARVADRLFPYEDPVGRRLYLAEHKDFYYIVGVLQHRDPTAAIGGSLAAQDFSNDVYIPISTLRQRIGDTVVTRGSGTFEGEILELNQITLRIKSLDDVEKTADLVKEMFGITENEDAEHAYQDENLQIHKNLQDVAVVVPKELLEQAKRMKWMFMFFMGMIAAISLLVGGIGIMNIMLATVTERTREIGIRRALGASQSDIVLQFLVETVVLTVVGGLIGIVGGFLCPVVIDVTRKIMSIVASQLLDSLPDIVRSVQPEVVPWSIPVAFSIAVLIGVAFGLYPAINAARMDPIEALRHE